jgi:hypothetical protein
MVPFQTAWAASQHTWSKLDAAITAVHVGVLARITAARGHASLVFDVLSSNEAPGLTALQGRSTDELHAAVEASARSGAIVLTPDPAGLLLQIANSGFAASEPRPHLTSPWLWETGTALHLVYALNFRRP